MNSMLFPASLDTITGRFDHYHAEQYGAVIDRYRGARPRQSIRREHSLFSDDTTKWAVNVSREQSVYDDIDLPEGFGGLSGTSIAAHWARDLVYSDGPFLWAPLHRLFAHHLHTGSLYQQLHPDCPAPFEVGLFLAAREQAIALAVERAAERKEIRNVLILAAGTTALPLGLVELVPDIQVIATDLAPMAEKQRQLKHFVRRHLDDLQLELPRLREDHQRLVVQPLDIFDQDHWTTVTQRLQPGGVAVVSEGLMPYLSLAQWQFVTRQVRSLLAARGGMWLTDIATQNGIARTTFTGDSARLLTQLYQRANVDPKNLAFKNGHAYEEFVRNAHLSSTDLRLTLDQYCGPKSVQDPDLDQLCTMPALYVRQRMHHILALPIGLETFEKIVTAPTCKQITL
jgi:O-methyltransferase involved in polyketide biosynthesis